MSEYPALTTLHDAWVGSGKKAPEAVRAFIELQAERALADDLAAALYDAVGGRGALLPDACAVLARYREARRP